MGLALVIPLIGPPAAGKTTLATLLGSAPGRQIFRLREHIPKDVLTATAVSSRRLGWIDDLTVAQALGSYFATVKAETHTVLLDNFPGSPRQVDRLLATLQPLAPLCRVEAVEVVTDAKTLKQRAQSRKVCHSCEHDPISDPRLPAIATRDDPWTCSKCSGLLHPRRGDSPRLLKARLQRYHESAPGIRAAFDAAGVPVTRLDTTTTISQAVNLLAPLLVSRSAAS
ncbi:AAA family ATPase [Nocardia brasiliensis]|uniref:AAA family ATPase n=1 Tax=Nocardia brasiliensis TaxID=37326 RepID=UPI0018939DBE|nr:AAA family ATPase [Nocardia brasiliensis]MBF6125525.1 AAA family ATPase [Nocardia brasiliensis]